MFPFSSLLLPGWLQRVAFVYSCLICWTLQSLPASVLSGSPMEGQFLPKFGGGWLTQPLKWWVGSGSPIGLCLAFICCIYELNFDWSPANLFEVLIQENYVILLVSVSNKPNFTKNNFTAKSLPALIFVCFESVRLDKCILSLSLIKIDEVFRSSKVSTYLYTFIW